MLPSFVDVESASLLFVLSFSVVNAICVPFCVAASDKILYKYTNLRPETASAKVCKNFSLNSGAGYFFTNLFLISFGNFSIIFIPPKKI